VANDRPGVDRVSSAGNHGQRLPGQRRLVDLHRITLQNQGVRRYDVPKTQPDEISGHELAGGDGRPLAGSADAGLQCQFSLERGNGVARLVFFPEADDRVDDQQCEYDAEIGPVADNGREDGGRLDHPGNRTPEVVKELEDRVCLVLGQLVVAILLQAALELVLAEAAGQRGSEARFQLLWEQVGRTALSGG
jgi:hypothetical protein